MDKIIWMLWFQGFDNAPLLVQKCVESWRRHNSDWRIVLLDAHILKEYVDIEPIIAKNAQYITPQARANVVRINLLQKYGGVWVDATCFCQKPLSMWLPEVMSSGFFAFRDPGPDRVMSNWFLASEKDCYLTQKLCEVISAYWQKNTFSGIKKSSNYRFGRLLMRYTRKNTTRSRIWFEPIVLKLLKWYPLFWFHYLFAKTMRSDTEFSDIWKRTPYRHADPIHALQRFGQSRIIDEDLKQRVDSKHEPLYKLSWKKARNEGIVSGSALDYLFTQAIQ